MAQITMSRAEDVIEAANATTEVSAPAKTGKPKVVSELEKLKAIGREIVSKMSAEEKATLSSKSDTLTFLGYVVMNSKTEIVHRQQLDAEGNVVYQKDENGNDKLAKNGKRMPATATESPKAVGVVFVSTEDVTVPVIDARYTTANFDPKTVKVDTRVVPAGTKIVLTLLEAMRFLAQSEYSTQFRVEANPSLHIKANTGFIALNTKAFASGQSQLPSVSFNFQKDCGAPRDLKALYIDKQDASGKWVPNDSDPDAVRFAFMLEPKRGSRPKKEVAPKDPAADRYAVAAAIRNLFNM